MRKHASGDAAVALVEALRPNVVLMDVPRVDGVQDARGPVGRRRFGERRRVCRQFELQNIDEETNRSVIVVNDESDEFQLRHLPVS